MSTRPLRVRVAFEIIVQHFNGQILKIRQTEIYKLVREKYDSVNAYVGPIPERDDVKKALTYLNHFGLVEKCRPQPCWYIKSVEKMCDRLCDLTHDHYIEVRELKSPISLAFEIIIHHFNGRTVPETEIETRIRTEIENYPGELSQYQNDKIVPHTLRFLNYFGFAKGGYIKSVDQMCDQLRNLDDNRNNGGC